MNGKVDTSFTREGFSMRMTVPLTHERWPNHAVDVATQPESA